MVDYTVQIAPADGVSKDALLQALSSKRHPGDAGFNLPALQCLSVCGGQLSHKIPLGMRVQVRKRVGDTFVDWPWFLLLRSSTASKTSLRLANAIGVMDAGYRGEVIAIVDNPSRATIALSREHAYFQMVLPDGTPMEEPFVKIAIVPRLSETQRGSGGFGSTGNYNAFTPPEMNEPARTAHAATTTQAWQTSDLRAY